MKSIIKKWFKNHFAFFKKNFGQTYFSLVSYTDETNEKDKKIVYRLHFLWIIPTLSKACYGII